jgi:hypothetical protein
LYQQKRRQSQGKEPTGAGGTPKKQRVRKVSVSIAVLPYFIFLTDLFVHYFGLSVSGLTVMSARGDLVIVENIHDSDTGDQKGIYNRLRIVSVAFFVHMDGVMLAEHADCRAVPLGGHSPNMKCCSRVVKHVRLEGTQDL